MNPTQYHTQFNKLEGKSKQQRQEGRGEIPTPDSRLPTPDSRKSPFSTPLQFNGYQLLRGLLKGSPQSPSNPQIQGFTLLELLVVVIIVGILAAIAGPGWFTFVTRQRIGTVNSALLQAIQETQNKAQAEKISYSIAVRTKDGVPQIAIYPTPPTSVTNPTIADAYWRENDLGNDLGIRPNQVVILTNLAGNNTPTTNNAVAPIPNIVGSATPTTPYPTLTFTHTGDFPDPVPTVPERGFQFIVALPQGPGSNVPVPNSKKCVVVQTLIGGVRSGEGQVNPTTNPQGCL